MWPSPDRPRSLVVTLGQSFICTAYSVAICKANSGRVHGAAVLLGTKAKGRAGSAVLFRTSDGRKASSILRYRASLSRRVGDGLAGPFPRLSHASMVIT